jgi:peptidoglycan hydrolase-like protein with peptidoglycan-binding domain
MLIDGKGCIALTGRTFPHKEYQTKQVEGTANACYIASGWYPKAWIKGKHLGKYPALVEAIPFLYWRSSDMILGNDDDFNEYDSVGDNFHGFAPYSAGCVTVRGYMAPPQSTDDWKVAYDWIYSIHKNNQSFSAVLFNFRDVENLNIQKLRFGSTGSQVEHMQTLLKKYIPEMDVDGSFGPATHAALRTFQAKCGIPDTGIYGILTMAALEVSAS